jgi:hypothetical protein
LVPELDGPIYKGIFSDICRLLSAPNFSCMIDLAQIAWFLQTIAYILPSPFYRVRFEESTYASYLSALCQGFPVRIISMLSKFSRHVLDPV